MNPPSTKPFKPSKALKKRVSAWQEVVTEEEEKQKRQDRRDQSLGVKTEPLRTFKTGGKTTLCGINVADDDDDVQPLKQDTDNGKTLFVFDERCTNHKNFDSNREPERPERVGITKQHLEAVGLVGDPNVIVQDKIRGSAVSDRTLRAVHSAEHIEWVEGASLLPQMCNVDSMRVGQDLYASKGTSKAARLACSGVVGAVRQVCSSAQKARQACDIFRLPNEVDEDPLPIRNAMCVVRPPAHHCSSTKPSGFCFYNNVAVAARAAQKEFPDVVKKVLILDWDVHHGDGTQEVFYEDPSVCFFSIHQHGFKRGQKVRYTNEAVHKIVVEDEKVREAKWQAQHQKLLQREKALAKQKQEERQDRREANADELLNLFGGGDDDENVAAEQEEQQEVDADVLLGMFAGDETAEQIVANVEEEIEEEEDDESSNSDANDHRREAVGLALEGWASGGDDDDKKKKPTKEATTDTTTKDFKPAPSAVKDEESETMRSSRRARKPVSYAELDARLKEEEQHNIVKAEEDLGDKNRSREYDNDGDDELKPKRKRREATTSRYANYKEVAAAFGISVKEEDDADGEQKKNDQQASKTRPVTDASESEEEDEDAEAVAFFGPLVAKAKKLEKRHEKRKAKKKEKIPNDGVDEGDGLEDDELGAADEEWKSNEYSADEGDDEDEEEDDESCTDDDELHATTSASSSSVAESSVGADEKDANDGGNVLQEEKTPAEWINEPDFPWRQARMQYNKWKLTRQEGDPIPQYNLYDTEDRDDGWHPEDDAAYYPGTGHPWLVGGDITNKKELEEAVIAMNGGSKPDEATDALLKRAQDLLGATSGGANGPEDDVDGSMPPPASPAEDARGKNINVPWPTTGFGDLEYMKIINELFLPVAKEFKPDLIIISCGFDCAQNDILGSMNVTPSGFYAMTSAVATACPRVVVALEGGYNIRSVALGAEGVMRALVDTAATPYIAPKDQDIDDDNKKKSCDKSCPAPFRRHPRDRSLMGYCRETIDDVKDVQRPFWQCFQ